MSTGPWSTANGPTVDTGLRLALAYSIVEYRPVVSCGKCDKTVSAIVAGYFNTVTDDLGSAQEFEQFIVAKCPECSSPFLLIRDGLEDANGERWNDAKTLHPTVSTIFDPSVLPTCLTDDTNSPSSGTKPVPAYCCLQSKRATTQCSSQGTGWCN